MVEERMIAGRMGDKGKGLSKFCTLVLFYLMFKVTKINPVFIFTEYMCLTLCVNYLSIHFYFNFIAVFSLRKRAFLS